VALYSSIPITRHREDTLRHVDVPVLPEYLVSDYEPRTNRFGDAIYERPKLDKPNDDLFQSGTLKYFDQSFCTSKSAISRSAEHLFRLIANSCEYSAVPLLLDHNKRLLQLGLKSPNRATAFLEQLGNVSKHFEIDEMNKALKTDRKQLRCARGVLLNAGLIQPEKLDPGVVTKMKAARANVKGGAPICVLRFRVHPFFGWRGHYEDRNSYINSAAYRAREWKNLLEMVYTK
jgi:hypothetical protein